MWPTGGSKWFWQDGVLIFRGFICTTRIDAKHRRHFLHLSTLSNICQHGPTGQLSRTIKSPEIFKVQGSCFAAGLLRRRIISEIIGC